jgi:hypothetical protein
MTGESLTAYLKNKVGEDWQQKTEETKEALLECKILDPACGSGAFPMGILNKIIDILKTVEPEINIYETKLNLIEKCIYGVDIQPIAVQIAKLRFFISLICEQTPDNNPNDNYGIIPLPNLESKFVAADTLIPLNTEQKDRLNLDDSVLQKMKNDLWNIRNHKNLRASSWQEKKKIRKEDKELCKNIENYLLTNSAKPDMEKIEQNKLLIRQFEKQITELPEDWVEPDSKQSSLFGYEHQNKLFQIDRNKVKRDDLLIRIQQCRKEIEKEERKATFTGLEAEIHKMVGWDPYDQNAVSPFFDPEWMFGLPQRFDIVIGNPPYRQIKWLSKNYSCFGYETFSKNSDIYCLFFEQGTNLLKKKGIGSFITSNKWLRTDYGRLLKSFFIKNRATINIVDFNGYQVFETATVDTAVTLWRKDKDIRAKVSIEQCDSAALLTKLVFSNDRNLSSEDIWIYHDNNVLDIKTKIEERFVKLSECNLELNYGILTGANTVFILNSEKRNMLITKNEKINRFIVPILRGKDLHKYGYVFNHFYLLNLHNGVKENNIQPVILNPLDDKELLEYLNSFGDSFKNRGEQGENWYNLRSCNYIDRYLFPKILYADISKDSGKFIYDEDGFYTNDTAFMIYHNDKNYLKYLTGILNSEAANFFYLNFYCGGVLGKNGIRFKKEFISQIPIPSYSPIANQPLITLVEYILFLKQMHNESIIPIYYENIIDTCVYELYFSEEIHAVKKGVIEHLQNLQQISDSMSDEQKLSIVNSEFERLYDPYHPVRNNVETIENIETIRIIKSSVK